MNVEVDASVILNGIKANKLNKDKDAKAAFADGVEDVTGGTVTNIDAKTVNTQRRSLMDEKATEVSFTVVLEELVDEGADYATVSETLLQSVKADLAASVEDATLEAALVNAAAASGSDVLAEVGVDVEASVAAVEDATSTFEVTAVSETAGRPYAQDRRRRSDRRRVDRRHSRARRIRGQEGQQVGKGLPRHHEGEHLPRHGLQVDQAQEGAEGREVRGVAVQKEGQEGQEGQEEKVSAGGWESGLCFLRPVYSGGLNNNYPQLRLLQPS